MEDSKFEKPLRLLLKGLKQRIGNRRSPGFKAFLDEITININNEIDMWDYYQKLFNIEENRLKAELEKYSKQELEIIKKILNETN